jgi:hypothetical protein
LLDSVLALAAGTLHACGVSPDRARMVRAANVRIRGSPG